MMFDVFQKVEIDRGYVGNCGVKRNFQISDTYWCYDTALRRRTRCIVSSPNLHYCCITPYDGCDEEDMKVWRF